MIGAVVLRFRAATDGTLPLMNGRLVHAAFFSRLREFSPALSASIHDGGEKPFTLSPLWPLRELSTEGKKSALHVRTGETFALRLSAAREDILCAALSVRAGERWQFGGVSMDVTDVLCDGEHDADSGFIDENELIAMCLAAPPEEEITFRFISPVSFRVDNRDFPFPLPELVFGSLAAKWNAAGFSLSFNKDEVKAVAEILPVCRFGGVAAPYYFGRDRGVTAFAGTITFGTRGTDAEFSRLLLLLAQFSNFLGVGRLTAQGFGQTRTRYR